MSICSWKPWCGMGVHSMGASSESSSDRPHAPQYIMHMPVSSLLLTQWCHTPFPTSIQSASHGKKQVAPFSTDHAHSHRSSQRYVSLS
jgi:hypothetical protein